MKKGQLWYGDFAIGIFIIILISVIFYFVLFDIGNVNSQVDELELHVENIANYLMSEGYGNWDNKEGKIGIVINNKIDNDLKNAFYNLPHSDSKEMFGLITVDYSAFITTKTGVEILNGEDVNTIIAENLIRIDRLVFYDENEDGTGEIVKLSVVVYK